MSNANKAEASRLVPDESEPAGVRFLREQVESLQFDTEVITAPHSRIVQVEKNRKLRLDPVQLGAASSGDRPGGTAGKISWADTSGKSGPNPNLNPNPRNER